MTHRIFALFAFVAVAASAPAQDPTSAPAKAAVAYTAEGRGVQIYRCAAASNGAYQWSFQGPEAQLFDTATGKAVGKHGAGPSWTWNDGSSIQGKVIATSPSSDANSIPWLLLEAHPVPNTHGALSEIAYVRRADTKGGKAPATGCDAAHDGATERVPYTATYLFYKQGQ